MKDILVGAAGAILAIVTIAAAETVFGALSTLFGPSIPPGAVVAFDGECPDNWERYQLGAGRFLLGASSGRSLHDVGGSEEHTLTIAEMPNHNHDGGGFLVSITGDNTVSADTDATGQMEINIRHGFPMVAVGEGAPHNNMPPFLVVSFCEKN